MKCFFFFCCLKKRLWYCRTYTRKCPFFFCFFMCLFCLIPPLLPFSIFLCFVFLQSSHSIFLYLLSCPPLAFTTFPTHSVHILRFPSFLYIFSATALFAHSFFLFLKNFHSLVFLQQRHLMIKSN